MLHKTSSLHQQIALVRANGIDKNYVEKISKSPVSSRLRPLYGCYGQKG